MEIRSLSCLYIQEAGACAYLSIRGGIENMKTTLRQKAFEEIRRKIICFEMMPGEKLSDKEIAVELGIGRTPVREALLILEREKLVQCQGKRGYFIKKLTRKEVDDYLSIREVLEIYSVPLIIKNITPVILEQLKKTVRRSEVYARRGAIREMASCNDEFHDILYRTTGSETLVDVMSSLSDKFHWLRSMVLTADERSPEEGMGDHREMIEALGKGSAKDMKKVVVKHLRRTKAKYMKIAKLFPLA
jgi:DNA-binding GntR family transcriptional regulator